MGMSQKNRCARIKPSLAASCAIGARTGSGVPSARALSPLSLLHLHRCTTPVRPSSSVTQYTGASPQAHVDFVRSISTGLRLNDVPTSAQLTYQCTRNRLAPDYLSRNGSFLSTSICAPGEMKDTGNHIRSMSEQGIISSPLGLGQRWQFRLRPIDGLSKRHGKTRCWMQR